MDQSKGKRVLLIEPRGNFPFYVFPLSLGYLKSNIPGHHQVEIFDCSMDGIISDSPELREKIMEFGPDIVGVSASIQTYAEGIKAVRMAKSIDSNIVTVMGGAHPSIFSEKAMEDLSLDFVFRGESELSFPVFLDILNGSGDFSCVSGLVYRENGGLRMNELGLEENLDSIHVPDYKATKLDEYILRGYNYGGHYGRTAPIWLTRGCPSGCSFCSATLINGRRIRRHSLEYVYDWIAHLYDEFDIRQFAIIDDNFTFDLEYAKDFCRGIIACKEKKQFKAPIHFASPNGIRLEKVDSELLSLMKRTGWHDVTIAPESGSRRTLKAMRKAIDPDKVPDAVETIKTAGLRVRAYFMMGYPGETKEDIKDTVKLIRKCKLDTFTIGRFTPIPGTPVFHELVRKGEISPDYMPPNALKFLTPFGNKEQCMIYTPQSLGRFNSFWIYLCESILLVLRNPSSLIFFLRYYGVRNIIKKLLFIN